ncbi:branched-chain/neutral amino acids amide ABC transporter periplasmic substrate-binding protein 1 [Natrialba hulunbeirensis JCM 10989]|uniref:Branched-chain/neutral amino acids amide ABC transporter periplasmic substrate-binding protein 1 n=1 Tax=Natrialba hulunbeirensis JCM 10989 TaxID=1227493 RepID=L9ZPS9_9EURY|nr:ABC transporter substrate-binding protein [Natrialba hulunbeirensis]ELY87552.1 branched-chain/neutral amino acids amide ABC transporter periplasmic substrate-binding protein 1 [Natrialba hulunbeirensis JCM 10989]
MVRELNRRRVLSGIGAAGIAGFAGCIGDEEEVTEGGPDVLNIIGYPESGIQIFRDYYSNFDDGTDIIVPDGLQDGDLPGEVGNDMDNVLGTAPASEGPNEAAFEEMYEDEYDSSPGVFNSHTFDAVAVCILANIAAGDNDGEAIRDQMRRVANPGGDEYGPGDLQEAAEAAADGEEISYQGASSGVNFDDVGDPADAGYDVWEFEDGGTETIDTIAFEGDDPDGEMADDSPGGTDREVMVAMLLPETGDLGELGSPMIQAGELAADQFEGTGFEIDLAIEDTETDEDATISNGGALIDAGYPAIIGAASSGNSVPLVGETSSANVVQCSPASTALSLSNVEDDGYFFRTAPSDLLQGQVMAEVAADRLDGETAATLYVNNDYGQQLSEQFIDSFVDDQGGEELNTVSFEAEQGSYTGELESALAE